MVSRTCKRACRPEEILFEMVSHDGPIVPMILAYAQDAPQFSGIAEILAAYGICAGVVDDEEKKRLVGRYADQ